MALAFDAATTHASLVTPLATAAVATITHTPVGVPSLVIVEEAERRITGTCSGITYGGVAMAIFGTQNTNGLNNIWYLQSPAAGVQNVIATQGAQNSQGKKLDIKTYTGSDVSGVGSSFTAAATGASGTSATSTVTITSSAGEIVDDSSLSTAASGVTTIAVAGGATDDGSATNSSTFAGGAAHLAHPVTSMTWTYGVSKTFGAIAVRVKPSAVVDNPIFGMQEPMQHDAALLSW